MILAKKVFSNVLLVVVNFVSKIGMDNTIKGSIYKL